MNINRSLTSHTEHNQILYELTIRERMYVIN